MKNYDEVPYKDIQPGDRVVFMTTSTGQSDLKRGIYLGLRNGKCVIDWIFRCWTLVRESDNEPYDYVQEAKLYPWPRYNSFDFDKYTEMVRECQTLREKAREGYVFKDRYVVQRTQLRNNNVFSAKWVTEEVKDEF